MCVVCDVDVIHGHVDIIVCPPQNGEVQVFDAVNLKAVAVIHAHDSPLAALAFNYSGTKLASASTTVSNFSLLALFFPPLPSPFSPLLSSI